MTLPPYLVDTYVRYKQGTRQFVQWLTETAAKANSVANLYTDTKEIDTSSTGSGRPKGKARTQAKQSSKRAAQVPLSSFRALSNTIVAARSSIPDYIIVILRDILALRKECAIFYKAQELQKDAEMRRHNESHQYFVNTLEDVYRTLMPLNMKRKATSKANDGTTTEANGRTTANIFEHLDLEPTDDAPILSSRNTNVPR
jgi:hypothetical protein